MYTHQNFIMDTNSKGKDKGKEKPERSNREVLGDIGNVEVNQASRPIIRNKKQSEKAEAAANPAPELEVPANYDQGASPNNQNDGDDKTQQPNHEPADVDSPENKGSGRSSRENQIQNSPLTTTSKSSSQTSIEPENQPVDINADDAINNLAAENQPVVDDADAAINNFEAENQPDDIDADAANNNLAAENQPVDINAEDAINNLAVEEYLDELYNFYKLLEDENRVSPYMEYTQKEINSKMRTIVVDWLVEVHLNYNLKEETLFLNINIMDRYLSSTNVPKAELQLVGICTMSLACKYEENKNTAYPQVGEFLAISAHTYNRQQFLSRERDIIEKLEWNFSVPTSYVFLVRLIIGGSIVLDKEIENLAFYLTELGLANYEVMVLFSPSKIAAAAIYAARCMLNRIRYWNQYLENLAGYCKEQIRHCAKLLLRIHADAPDVKVKSVYRKFLSANKGYISLLPQPGNIEERL